MKNTKTEIQHMTRDQHIADLTILGWNNHQPLLTRWFDDMHAFHEFLKKFHAGVSGGNILIHPTLKNVTRVRSIQ